MDVLRIEKLLRDDVALDLVGAGIDRGGAQEEMRAHGSRLVVGIEDRVG